ncbi:MAG: radical SAM protein [bacterium]
MKIVIAYPPLSCKGNKKLIPLLSQNRQFQWFHSPTYIYPVVPACAATLLKNAGYEVIWYDGIAEKKTYKEFLNFVAEENPDLIMMETKTPVVKQHWKIINELKIQNLKLKIALVGDHVTALPEESMKNCNVDFILTGGDYDFLLLNLCRALKKFKIQNSKFKIQLEPGIWYRENGEIKNTGKFKLDHDLNTIPFIDRDLTKWKLYAYKNGNYKRTPGTYIMAGRDCWWGKCKFCSWTTLYPNFRTRKPEHVLDEIGILIDKYHIKEIMDDTGTFPVGEWLTEFCDGMIKKGYNKKIRFNCNMRFGALKQKDYDLMAKAGFRFILYGLESARQETLDRIHKNLKVSAITEGARMAKKAGLHPHLTTMIGYPWETREDALKTIQLAKELFRKGYVNTLQATIVIPYPGTPLFDECKKGNQLRTLDWNRYDMQEPVMKTPLTDADVKQFTQGLYKSFITPGFIFRTITSIRDFDDIIFILRAVKSVLGHLTDFKK